MTDISEIETILMVARNWGEDDTGCDVLLVHPKWRALSRGFGCSCVLSQNSAIYTGLTVERQFADSFVYLAFWR